VVSRQNADIADNLLTTTGIPHG